MSYCRFGEDSDVYVFQDYTSENYECCACKMDNSKGHWFKTPEGMVRHLMKHIRRGDKVPIRAFARLITEGCTPEIEFRKGDKVRFSDYAKFVGVCSGKSQRTGIVTKIDKEGCVKIEIGNRKMGCYCPLFLEKVRK